MNPYDQDNAGLPKRKRGRPKKKVEPTSVRDCTTCATNPCTSGLNDRVRLTAHGNCCVDWTPRKTLGV